ncbi:MAG: energy-coupling factor ABC transporter ATP-binding protein [Anaerolineae bacterium]
MNASIVQITNLSHEYEENIPAIYDINLDIPANALMAIIGHNGAGKTTLVKHLNGLLKPSHGQVVVAGLDTKSTTVASMARHVGYVFQNPDHQIFCPSVREEIEFGLRNLGTETCEVKRRVDQALEVFGLSPYAKVPPAMLGFGLRRKVSLASVLVMEPAILVLDEPTIGLDAHSTMEVFKHITRLHHKGHTIILVTHDMRLVAQYADLCLVLKTGHALAFGPTRSIFGNLELINNAGMALPAITALGRRMEDAGLPRDMLSVREYITAFSGICEPKP